MCEVPCGVPCNAPCKARQSEPVMNCSVWRAWLGSGGSFRVKRACQMDLSRRPAETTESTKLCCWLSAPTPRWRADKPEKTGIGAVKVWRQAGGGAVMWSVRKASCHSIQAGLLLIILHCSDIWPMVPGVRQPWRIAGGKDGGYKQDVTIGKESYLATRKEQDWARKNGHA